MTAPCIGVRESDVEDGDDFQRARIHHHDLVAHHEELVAAPIRIDRHDLGRQRMEVDLARHARADRDREVDVGLRLDVVILVRCSVESCARAPAWPVVVDERSRSLSAPRCLLRSWSRSLSAPRCILLS